jgi:hypothetical protein
MSYFGSTRRRQAERRYLEREYKVLGLKNCSQTIGLMQSSPAPASSEKH